MCKFSLKTLCCSIAFVGMYSLAHANRHGSSEKHDTKADNSAMNRNNTILSSQDQATGSHADVEVTRRIRQQLSDDPSLSTYAKNIKIITLNGLVTLKGPVRSQAEKEKVEFHAKQITSVSAIRNRLDIVPLTKVR